MSSLPVEVVVMLGQTVEKVHADMERDRFFKADEAAEYGLIDKVLDKH